MQEQKRLCDLQHACKENGRDPEFLTQRHVKFRHRCYWDYEKVDVGQNVETPRDHDEEVHLALTRAFKRGLAEEERQEQKGGVQDEAVQNAEVDEIFRYSIWSENSVIQEKQRKLGEEHCWAPECGKGFPFLASKRNQYEFRSLQEVQMMNLGQKRLQIVVGDVPFMDAKAQRIHCNTVSKH
ncbi:MAG: hypothetical protein Q9193_002920 [Seirophora villosa]